MLENYNDILSVKDMCDILSISRKTAYIFLQSNEVPYRRIGRHYKIPKDGIINYLMRS